MSIYHYLTHHFSTQHIFGGAGALFLFLAYIFGMLKQYRLSAAFVSAAFMTMIVYEVYID